MTNANATRPCHNCGYRADEKWHFCPDCGEKFSLTECPECNNAVDPGWKFCRNCGNDLSRVVIQKPAPPEPEEKPRAGVAPTPATVAASQLSRSNSPVVSRSPAPIKQNSGRSFAFWAYVALNVIFAIWHWSTFGTGYQATMIVVVNLAITLVVIYLPLKLIGGFMRRRRS